MNQSVSHLQLEFQVTADVTCMESAEFGLLARMRYLREDVVTDMIQDVYIFLCSDGYLENKWYSYNAGCSPLSSGLSHIYLQG